MKSLYTVACQGTGSTWLLLSKSWNLLNLHLASPPGLFGSRGIQEAVSSTPTTPMLSCRGMDHGCEIWFGSLCDRFPASVEHELHEPFASQLAQHLEIAVKRLDLIMHCGEGFTL